MAQQKTTNKQLKTTRPTHETTPVKQATMYAYTSWVTVPGQFWSLTQR